MKHQDFSNSIIYYQNDIYKGQVEYINIRNQMGIFPEMDEEEMEKKQKINIPNKKDIKDRNFKIEKFYVLLQLWPALFPSSKLVHIIV